MARKSALSGRLHETWPPTGGISADMLVPAIEGPERQLTRLVLRRYRDKDLSVAAQTVAGEYRLLRQLAGSEVAVPEAILFDDTGQVLHEPYLPLAYVPGRPAPRRLLARQPDLARRPAGGRGRLGRRVAGRSAG